MLKIWFSKKEKRKQKTFPFLIQIFKLGGFFLLKNKECA